MNLLNQIRYICFWAVDILNGNTIKRHYREVASVLDYPDSDSNIRKREELLQKLLKHAINTTPFYKKLHAYSSINDFPVIKKNVVQENFNDFKSSEHLNRKNLKVSTSGSTGIPFIIYHDKNKRLRNSAETIYFLNTIGYKIGDRLYYFRLWKGETKSFFKTIAQNIIKVDVSRLSDVYIDKIIHHLKQDPAPKFFIGIASALESICRYLDNTGSGPLEINAKSLIANSDALSPYAKEALQKHFKASVVSRYSNEELGIIAQQKINDNSNWFYINWATFYVEIFKMDEDTPAPMGETGRIVVTDLFNYCMPMVRYDTGDIGCMGYNSNREKVLTIVEGRKMDAIYDTSGKLLSAYTIYPKFQKYYNNIRQYQFIQTGEKEYLVKLNVDNSFKDEKELIESFKNELGPNAIISVQYVSEVPLLSSGKRKKVMNMLSQNG